MLYFCSVVLLMDNFDSFTFNLRDYLEQCGAEVDVVRRDKITEEHLKNSNYSGLVISPGPGQPFDHPEMKSVLDAFVYRKPVLGICLGHQAIGCYFGARLVRTEPMHGKISLIQTENHTMYRDIPSQHRVCRYHSLILEDPLPDDLYITARSDSGLIMGLAHKHLPVFGVQYHPEAILTENGLTLLRNWLNLVYLQDTHRA